MSPLLRRHRQWIVVGLAFVAFISLGLPDGLVGVAWPSMRAEFGQPVDALGILIIAMISGYLVSSFLSGALVQRFGVGLLLTGSVALTGLALLGYSLSPAWSLMIGASVFLGLGAGAIDAGLNNYVAHHHSDGLMQWLHASFGVGVTLGPMIMSAGLIWTDTWRTGYWIVAAGQLVLAVVFLLTTRLWERDDTSDRTDETEDALAASFRATLGEHRAWLGFLLFLIYAGLEVTLGLWAYTLLTEERGIAPETAALWVSVYWGMFTVGRMVAGLVTRHLGLLRVMGVSLMLAVVAAIMLIWQPTPLIGLLGLAVAGFAYAPIFPAMVSSTRQRLSQPHVTNTIGMQFSGAGLGAAIMPPLAGAIAARTSLDSIPWFVLATALVLGGLYWLALTLAPHRQGTTAHDQA